MLDPYALAPPAPGYVPAPDSAGLPDDLTIEITEDGGVTLHAPAVHSDRTDEDCGDHGENLAEKLGDGGGDDGQAIAERVLQGIDADKLSRTEWISTYTKGLELLGLKIEDRDSSKSQRGNISRVRDPLLLEAVVKAQSLARGELLPADGPCKGTVLGEPNDDLEELAENFQTDLNAYLTVGAPEYYPDFDRGLFGLFFSGNLFRKVYAHPIRRRPSAESIDVDDLIVSEDATDLETAVRVTHRLFPSPAVTRRMQLAGHWLDLPLPQATPDLSAERRAEQQLSGIRPFAARPEDQERCVYETITDLDLAEWYRGEKGQPDGLPIPYVVTIDSTSRRLLALRRSWRRGDAHFMRRTGIVHYGMVPALGFLCLGYVHLLGNQTKALTAMLRIICDLGMYACFPGGVKAKGVRLGTNQINPEPGEWVDVDIAEKDDIRKALMALPYNVQAIPALVQAIELIRKDAQSLGAAPEIEVGEGRTNVPVGSIMAQIEQQTQVTAAVHKRLHTAQARELQLMKELIADDPEVLDRVIPNPSRRWAAVQEFQNVDVVPASDPNVPSAMHRIMRASAIIQVADANPDIYDKLEAHKRAWRIAGMADVDDLIHPAAQSGAPPPDPKVVAAQMAAQTKQADLQQKQQDNQRKAAAEAVAAQQHQAQTVAELQDNAEERASRERIAQTQQETERLRLAAELHRAGADRQHEAGLAQATQRHETVQAHLDRQHEAFGGALDQIHEQRTAEADREHEAALEDTRVKAAAKVAAAKPKPKAARPKK